MHRLRHPAAISVAIILLVFGLIFLLQMFGAFQAVELAVYDYHLKSRAPVQRDDPRIVLVTQTEDTIRKYDFPLPDALLAKLLGIIETQKPRAIGVDIYRDVPVPRDKSGQKDLDKILQDYPNIIWAFLPPTESRIGVPPPASLNDSPERIGVNDWPVDDQTVRRGVLYSGNGKDAVYASFPLLVALTYLAQEEPPIYPTPDPSDPQLLRLVHTTIHQFHAHDGGYVGTVGKEDAGYQFLLDYAGPRRFTTYTLDDVLTGKVPNDFARDRIVFIGSTAESTDDFARTPLNPNEAGVVIHAQIVNQLLRTAAGKELLPRVWTAMEQRAWLLLFSAFGGLIAFSIRSPWRLVPILGLVGTGLWLSAVYAFDHAFWIPFFPPLLGLVLSAGIVTIYMAYLETTNRRDLMDIFKRTHSSKVAEALWKQRDQFAEGGRPTPQKLVATVLFTDLKGFTTISEHLDPPKLLEWLNRYMSVMAEEVARHDGFVMKYMGDAIMAVFGAPLPSQTEAERDRDATNAVRCALAMNEALEKFNAKSMAEGNPPTGMRIGIFTGEVVAGCLGSAGRLEYSTIGDTVNTASRLESFDKDKGMDPPTNCRILIGEPTLRRIGPAFVTLKVDSIRLKGKEEATTIYRVLYEKKS